MQSLGTPAPANDSAASFMALIAPTLAPSTASGASAATPAVTIANPATTPATAGQKDEAKLVSAPLVLRPVSGLNPDAVIESESAATTTPDLSVSTLTEPTPLAAKPLPDAGEVADIHDTAITDLPKPLAHPAKASAHKKAPTLPEKTDQHDSAEAPGIMAPQPNMGNEVVKTPALTNADMPSPAQGDESEAVNVSQEEATPTEMPEQTIAEPSQTQPAKTGPTGPITATVMAGEGPPSPGKQSTQTKPRNNGASSLDASLISRQGTTEVVPSQTTAPSASDAQRSMTQTTTITPPATQAPRIAETSGIPQSPASITSAQPKSGDPLAMITLPDIVTDSSASQNAAPGKPVSTQPGRFGEELAVAIARHTHQSADARSETLMLRLDPPEHGRIEIKLTFEDGAPLRASLLASNPATLDMLRRDSADLFRALGQAGVSTDAHSFQFESRSQNGGQGQQHSAATHRSALQEGFNDNDAQTLSSATETAPDYRRLRNNSAVNLIT